MENIVIRKATMADMEILLRFEQSIIAAERPYSPTFSDEKPYYYYDLNLFLTSPDVMLVVAETGGRIIGSGYARIEKSQPYLKHNRHAYLGFMYVEPAYRGMNVNKKVIGALKDWVISKGIDEMHLEVYCENIGAIKAYEKVGFTPHMLKMRMGIDKS